MSHDHRNELFGAQAALEEALLAAVREFEKLTGMSVKSIKVYPGEWHAGRPITRAVEVGAQLR
jgi:phage gp37-like protein